VSNRKKNRSQITAVATDDVQSVRYEYSGLLPPPDFFAGYKRVLPTAPERILLMAEEQQRVDNKRDDRLLTIQEANEQSDRDFSKNGQIFSFVCTMSIIVSGSVIMGLTLFLGHHAPFYSIFSAGVLFGLAKIVRSFQEKGGKTTPASLPVKK